MVALPLFLQNIDTTVMATALPSIAHSLHVRVLDLNLAITAYLFSLAVLLPVSGWLAERFGAKRMFCLAIALFTAGSALCATAASLASLVAWRVVQGAGAATMLPVGRLILLRNVPLSQMVGAMVWFTVPGAVGRLVGPLLGGALVTVGSWQWIFLVNVPFGLLALALALRFIQADAEPRERPRLDLIGFCWLGCGLLGLFAALGTVGKGLVSSSVAVAFGVAGGVALLAYWLHARHRENPLVDVRIFRFATYRAAVLGGMPMRVAVGASPFLLPLMLQLGFGLTALETGLLTMATAVGSLGTRFLIAHALRAVRFKTLLIASTVCSSLFYAGFALFSPSTPHPLIFVVLMLGGLCNAFALVSLNALGFIEIPWNRMSHATTTSSMLQQLSVCLGVLMGATLLALLGSLQDAPAGQVNASHFAPAFVVVGLTTLLSLFWFCKLRADEGDEVRPG